VTVKREKVTTNPELCYQAKNSLFSKRFWLLSARKSPCSAAKSNLPQPFEFARRSGTNIAVEDRILKTALYFALLPENRPPPADRFASACFLSHSAVRNCLKVGRPLAAQYLLEAE
jgi:hypothetical protein